VTTRHPAAGTLRTVACAVVRVPEWTLAWTWVCLNVMARCGEKSLHQIT
jgi:hypothetical protein